MTDTLENLIETQRQIIAIRGLAERLAAPEWAVVFAEIADEMEVRAREFDAQGRL